ncbi:hypothetical protein DFP72DRAFT_818408 [Ephemerocybe angulata]|uniref:GCM domain-containing protein n=1 Tax=Ephemerocybe angulata TaxID=980116 RepID=A0A8H6M1H8_9AGAR|nr:hypothetical protein DFP72DRAFT_818408 [Tulosesus angulatus]
MWPSGNLERDGPEENRDSIKFNHYLWKSNGRHKHRGWEGVDVRKCLGVNRCPQCGKTTRPASYSSKAARYARNADRPCDSPGCRGKNVVPVEILCTAKSFHWVTIDKSGTRIFHWDHEGRHDHDRPPPKALSPTEKAQLDEQVLRNPNATAHQLRTGTLAPGSTPLHEISPVLAGPDAARYQLVQSKRRSGFATVATTTGIIRDTKTLSSLSDKDSGAPFLVASSINSPTHMIFQTPWMRDCLNEAVHEWETEPLGTDGRHGLVTDANESYFNDGHLVTTCAFNSVLLAWVPVLYTWILRQDANHYRPHFQYLFKGIVDCLGQTQFDKKYLLNVMDFSQGQRRAHADEYAETVLGIMRNQGRLYQLDQTAVDAQRTALISEAEAAQLGCVIHFERSVKRLCQTHALVDPSDEPQFRALLQALRSKDPDEMKDFDHNASNLRKDFPEVASWIDWWLQPAIASMIFPARSSVPEDTRNQVPATSNAVEHQHSLLNHAVGKKNDLISGANSLGIDGVHRPRGPQDPKRARPRKEYENDGRAPDTIARIIKADALGGMTSTPSPSGEPTKDIRSDWKEPDLPVNKKLNLMSYRWNGHNSCFWDTANELIFRSFCRWPPQEQVSFIKKLNKESFLSILLTHFTRRLKAMRKIDKTEQANYERELSTGQTTTEDYLLRRWKLITPGQYSDPFEYISEAIRDYDTLPELQGQFTVRELVMRKCANGHTTSDYYPEVPHVEFTHQPYHRSLPPGRDRPQ